MKTTTLPLRNLMNRSPLRAFLLIALALGWLALSPQARAVCQEGCLTNQNTVLGEDALISNTTGFGNSSSGSQALFSNTTGNFNTANGQFALQFNTTGTSNTATGVGALVVNTTGNGNTATGERVSQRASHSARIKVHCSKAGSDDRAAAEGFPSGCRAPSRAN
jgi:hypothetical protein